MKLTTKWSMMLVALTVAAAPMAIEAATKSPASIPSPVTTQQIEKQVRHELVMLPWLNIFDNLEFRVDGGTVILSGQVTWPTISTSAANVVRRIEGVTKVVNKIEVLPLSPFDDSIRLREARAIYGYPALQRYGMGTLPSIRIIVKNGNVTLEGVVDSQMDRNLAGIRAQGVPNVFAVTNNLRVARG